MPSIWTNLKMFMFLLFPKGQILDSSKLKEFADDNFKFVENGRKLSKPLQNTVGKGEIARYEQFLLSSLLSKELCCRCVKTRVCLGKGYRGNTLLHRPKTYHISYN